MSETKQDSLIREAVSLHEYFKFAMLTVMLALMFASMITFHINFEVAKLAGAPIGEVSGGTMVYGLLWAAPFLVLPLIMHIKMVLFKRANPVEYKMAVDNIRSLSGTNKFTWNADAYARPIRREGSA